MSATTSWANKKRLRVVKNGSVFHFVILDEILTVFCVESLAPCRPRCYLLHLKDSPIVQLGEAI